VTDLSRPPLVTPPAASDRQQPNVFSGSDPFIGGQQSNQPQPERQSSQPSSQPPAREQSQPSQQPQEQQQPQDDPFAYLPKPIPEQVLLTWQAPSRVFKQRSRQYFATIIVIGLLISLILLFAGQFLPIAVVLSVVFLVYILSTVPPGTASHKISNYGIWVEDNLYYWDEVGRYWYTEKFGQTLLHFEVARFPGRITLLLGTTTRDELDDLLTQVLVNEKPAPTFFDKAADWIEKNIPLDKE
jgi:hypothetical protein